MTQVSAPLIHEAGPPKRQPRPLVFLYFGTWSHSCGVRPGKLAMRRKALSSIHNLNFIPPQYRLGINIEDDIRDRLDLDWPHHVDPTSGGMTTTPTRISHTRSDAAWTSHLTSSLTSIDSGCGNPVHRCSQLLRMRGPGSCMTCRQRLTLLSSDDVLRSGQVSRVETWHDTGVRAPGEGGPPC